MPEYLSPGVYVEEVDAGPKPIEGVSTSTAAAAGVTIRGPSEGAPVLVTSFNEFQRTFGGFYPPPSPSLRNAWSGPDGGHWWRFPLSVKGFFDNGGQRLYIKRVLASTASFAQRETGRGVTIAVTRDAKPSDSKIKLESLIGISVGTNLVLPGTSASFPVTAYDAAANEVSLDTGSGSPGIGQTLIAGRDRVGVLAIANEPTKDQTLVFKAKAKGGWGNDLYVRTQPMYGGSNKLLPDIDPAIAGSVANTRLMAASDPASTQISVESSAGFAVGDRVLIAGVEYEVTAVAADALDLSPNPVDLQAGTAVKRLRPSWKFTDSATPTLRVWNASTLYVGAVVELDNGTDKQTTVVRSIVADTIELGNPVGLRLYEGHTLRVVEGRVDVRWAPVGEAAVTEEFSNLRLIDDGSSAYLVTLINLRSKLITVEAADLSPNPARFPLSTSLSDLQNFPSTADGSWAQFEDGDDKLGDLTPDDFVGEDKGPGQRTGVAAFEEIDEISMCMVPNVWAPGVQNGLILHCELLKDRFAIVDVAEGLDNAGVRAARENFSSSYAALYYPWLELRDPLAKQDVVVAPSGHMAGIYARVDVERGVFKAPANEVIRGINRIAQPVTKREQDMLNPKGINALRFFPGRGNRVWGARTLSADPAWKYINVRRLFLFIEESIDEGTQWVVFEPNDEPLWARVRASISNFLTTVWRSGALQGATAEQAFFVKCDHTTMTQDDIDNGRLICVIGVAPVKPAEFVIFRIQQKTLEVEA